MSEEYISGEQYQELRRHQQQRRPKQTWFSRLPMLMSGLVVMLAVVFAVGWYSGAHHQKSHDSQLASSNTSAQSQQGLSTQGGGPMLCSSGSSCQQSGGSPPVVGTITAVSATSITIRPTGSNTTETFSITSNTEVANGPNQGMSTFNASNFQVGETVGVAVSGPGSTQAQAILPNPQMEMTNTN